VWLCQTCSRIIDAAPDAYTADGLRAWKVHAERLAARDAMVTSDEVGLLIADIDAACNLLLEFAQKWQDGDPVYEHRREDEDFGTYTRELIGYGERRVNAYFRDVAPAVASVITRTEHVLGPDPELESVAEEAVHAHVNYLGMRFLVAGLQRLAALLALR